MSSGMGPDGWKIVGDYHFLMRKPRSNRGVNSAKQSSVPKTVDEYLVAVPEPARSTLNKIRAAIQSVVPADTTRSSATAFQRSDIKEYSCGTRHFRTIAVFFRLRR
jgi:hypothetical protein